ncbi:MAG: hypothetical protein PHT88_05265 [Candidatus Moranbacteria bacterium]|nr:hypothetical protein [Candidatus Moranbacteria bacterium]
MSKTKTSAVVAVSVVALSVAVYYWYATEILNVKLHNEDAVPPYAALAPGSKQLTVVKKYMATEDKEDTLRFVVTVDREGIITDILTLDAKTNEIPEKKKSFNEGLTVAIKGKKMSELGPVDKIGTSTYTTDAFNSVIDELKAQL